MVEALAESLAEQTCRDFEWVVQDGGSTDATAERGCAYEARLPVVKWHSCPDRGIYDAWNKAVARAGGEWLIFFGADDRLAAADVLERVKAILNTTPENLRFASGGLDIVTPDGQVQRHLAGQAVGVRRELHSHIPFGHPALFYRQAVFQDGLFDSTFRIAGDYDLLARSWRDDAAAIRLDFTVARMLTGGVSDNPRLILPFFKETQRVVWRYFGVKGVAARLGYLLRKACSAQGVQKIIGAERSAKIQRLWGKDH